MELHSKKTIGGDLELEKIALWGLNPAVDVYLPVDQETAVKGTEPLATLATFRKVNNKINFGQNLIALDYHDIFEGDEIHLES